MVSGKPITPESTLLPGTPVEIVDGPFAGLRGKFLSHTSGCRLFVEVRFLRCGVSVEIERRMVKTLETTEPMPCGPAA
jgi:transcription antitermination factor NusG